MKKLVKSLWAKVLDFWYFTVRNRRQKRLVMGGFDMDFHMYDLRIRTLSKNFSMKIRAGEYSFGYLAASIGQGHEDNLHGYAVFMYLLATNICKDDKLRKEVQRAIERYQRRAEAKEVSEMSDDEAAIAAEKRDMERANMSRRQRRRAEREFQKRAKQILKEDKDNE